MTTQIQVRRASARGGDSTRAVVVGVDGSERNLAALDYAVCTAGATGRPLALVAVVDDYTVPIPHHATRPNGHHDWQVLMRLAATIEAEHPQLTVRRDLQVGDTVECLLARSTDQHTLVVGKRGLGTVGRLLVGSTSTGVAGRSRVPVVVVPDRWRHEEHRGRPVLIGLPLDRDAEDMLRYAFSEAAARGVPLRVVHALEPLVFDPGVAGPSYWEERDIAQIAELLAPYRREFPRVQVFTREARGNRTSVLLLEESRRAQLVVLGRHHHGRFGFRRESVGREVLRYSDVPVAVVPSA